MDHALIEKMRRGEPITRDDLVGLAERGDIAALRQIAREASDVEVFKIAFALLLGRAAEDDERARGSGA